MCPPVGIRQMDFGSAAAWKLRSLLTGGTTLSPMHWMINCGRGPIRATTIHWPYPFHIDAYTPCHNGRGKQRRGAAERYPERSDLVPPRIPHLPWTQGARLSARPGRLFSGAGLPETR